MLITEFLDLDIEKQSLYVRNLFERAAANYSSKNKGELYVFIHGHHAYLHLNDNDAQILSAYNETLFPESEFIEMGEGLNMIRVTKETLTRYCSSMILATISEIDLLDSENNWRSNEAIFDVSGIEPRIVFRGMNGPKFTASYYYCDAQTVISQQLINYQQIMIKRDFQKTDLFSHLAFPAVEGRGAIFSFAGVPFHAYNAKIYNDLLGQYIGLFDCDYNQVFWVVNQKSLAEKGFSFTQLTVDEGVSLLPEITKRQMGEDYLEAIRIPLTSYIAYSLKYQRSLPLKDRIYNDETAHASNKAIDQALEVLNTIGQEKTPILTKGPSFFKFNDDLKPEQSSSLAPGLG